MGLASAPRTKSSGRCSGSMTSSRSSALTPSSAPTWAGGGGVRRGVKGDGRRREARPPAVRQGDQQCAKVHSAQKVRRWTQSSQHQHVAGCYGACRPQPAHQPPWRDGQTQAQRWGSQGCQQPSHLRELDADLVRRRHLGQQLALKLVIHLGRGGGSTGARVMGLAESVETWCPGHGQAGVFRQPRKPWDRRQSVAAASRSQARHRPRCSAGGRTCRLASEPAGGEASAANALSTARPERGCGLVCRNDGAGQGVARA